MKKILLPALALLMVYSTAAQCSAAEGPVSMFAFDHDWSWRNLTYGPLEILATPVMLIIGPVAGVNGGIDYFDKEEDTTFQRIMKSTAGTFIGGTLGIMAVPAVAAKGVFDTVTGGAFCTSAFFG